MDTKTILFEIDREIAQLRQARELLAESANPAVRRTVKDMLGEAAHKRIGDAQRKRWAAQKKLAK